MTPHLALPLVLLQHHRSPVSPRIVWLILALTSTCGPLLSAPWPGDAVVRGLTRVEHSSVLDQTPFAHWQVFASPALGMPVLGFGPPVSIEHRSDRWENALALVKATAGSNADFEWCRTTPVGGLTRVHWRETRDGLPVLSGRADLVANARGELMRWSLRAHDSWPTAAVHRLSIEDAAASLASRQPAADWQPVSGRCFAAWYPDYDRHELRPVYWIRIAGSRPEQRWEGIVDAITGDVLLDWPGIATDVLSGTVRGQYWPEYLHEDPQIGPHRFESVTINGNQILSDSGGAFSQEAGQTADVFTALQGSWVAVENDRGDDGQFRLFLNAPFADTALTWTTDSATAAELNLYWHTVFVHQWYKVLDPGFSGMDYPVPAVANYGVHYDNAFWNGYGTYYGSGGQYSNFGMFSDVIYHEYTHGVTGHIYPDGMLPYVDQPGALNEAWSDYIACTINDDPYVAEYIGGDQFHSYFRDLTNHLVFPRDWRGEVHDDSRFVSAALWTIRVQLGAAIADSLAHFARYALEEDFLGYLTAVLETDDDDGDLSNGTPHSAVIYAAFGDHGIGPGDDPHFAVENLQYYADGTGGSVGDGDRWMEQGETVEMLFDLVNAADLYPPPAADVQITVTVSDSEVTVINGSQSVASLPPHERFQVAPIRLVLPVSMPDHWLTVHTHVTANGGSAVFDDEFDFSVGTPHLLIVEDDPTSDVERYVVDALHANDQIYDRVSLNAGGSLPAASLPSRGLVIWVSGNADGAILTTSDRTLIQSFVNAGNRVLLTGQSMTQSLRGTAYARDFLQVDISADTIQFSHSVTADTDPFTAGEWYLLVGSAGAGNQREATTFTPLGSARAVIHYSRSQTGPVAAVEFADGRGIVCGFGIEAISGMATGSQSLRTFLQHILQWASDVLPADPERPNVAPPTAWSIGPVFPNPFNNATRISYSIPAGQRAELVIFDVLGRAVEPRAIASTTGSMIWSPQSASGVYFAQLRWKNGQTPAVKLLLLR